MKKTIIKNTVLITAFALIILLIGALIILDFTNKQRAVESLEKITAIYSQNVANSPLDIATKIPSEISSDTRITIVNEDGMVIYDNMEDSEKMDNHLTRQEVSGAFEGSPVPVTRKSETLGKKMIYYAVTCISQEHGRVAVRLAMPLAGISASVTVAIVILAVILIAVILISIGLAGQVSKVIISPIENICLELNKIQGGGFSKLHGSKYNEIDGLIGGVNDVSEKLSQTLKSLEGERSKLYFVLNSMQEGIVAVNDNHEIVLLNRFACETFGIPEFMEGKNIHFLTDNKQILDCFHNESENKILKVKLNERIYQCRVSSLADSALSVMLLTDITEEVQLAEVKANFFDSASHELKTPITSLKGFAELLATNNNLDDDAHKYLGIMSRDTDRLLAIIEDMLYLSKLEQAEKALPLDKIDLRPLIDETISQLSLQASQKNITITVTGAGKAKFNPEGFVELVTNLVDNAIKYNKDGGKIDILISDKTLIVKDSGIGIEQKHLSRIFDRFYRVEKGRSRANGGTGLGLAIVKHIALSNNAEVSVKSVIGSGTDFTIKFSKTN